MDLIGLITKWIQNQINVKLKTLEEYRGRFEEKGKFMIIQSEEVSDQFENKPLHMNVTNIQKKIDPQGGNSVVEVLQNNIDAAIKQRDELNTPMIPHINHPNFGHAISLEDMIALRNEKFFEVYNGHPSVNNSGDSAPYVNRADVGFDQYRLYRKQSASNVRTCHG